MFGCLGLDRSGPAARVDPPGTGEVFSVFGLRYDRADALIVTGVLPAEHAAAVVEPDGAGPQTMAATNSVSVLDSMPDAVQADNGDAVRPHRYGARPRPWGWSGL
ncbi:hypothetical protein [Streptomyces sp. NPDC052042]|uniref:hypothetical protein n=1 Tax=Streptomyces sp. NPDC052042 TaxID=3365683 RepID=UPI0037CCD66E